jgi:Carboxypeptidase regulatory-like domain/TonB dependent receptor-like, beta-barrel/TonB-dependent Receptor Plug Domain
MRLTRTLVVLTVLLASFSMFAQVTANLTGTVTMDNNPLPGATVTATSPQMQGSRTTTSDVNGNYNIASVPPGTYKVVIEMQGMQTVTRNVLVGVGQTSRVDATMKMSAVAEAITVTASAPAVLETTEVQTNLQQAMISKLPTQRTVQGVALLAPGTVSNGPRNALVISGATADQNLIMVDGAVIQENLRGQTHALFIEDAIQETTVLTGAISAEYGRFQGGVVNSITKSGGNEFHGSYRDNLDKPSWKHPSAFGEARGGDITNQVHEGTLGGRIIRDRLWFFGAGRKTKSSTPNSYARSQVGTPFVTFPVVTDEKRWEGKLTGQITPKYSLVGTYLKVPLKATNNCQLGCLDSLTLDPSIQQGNDFKTAHFNGVVTNNWLIESLYSRKTFTFIGFGGESRDPYIGSPFLEFTPTGARLGTAHAPYFCGVCGNETRNNNSWNVKSTYFWSTKGLGTHNIVGGYERWAESRFSNNYQSPTNFTINSYQEASGFHRDPATGLPLTQVRGSTPGTNSWITYFPILTPSLGSDLRTKSGFFNDKWDLNTHWSFNIGGRFDKNQSVDSLHQKTSDDQKVSPRVGLNYDVLGNGKYRLTAGYNVYVGRLAEGINGAGSPAGSPATFVYEYRGPDFASVTSEQAVKIMMDWFLQHGGVSPANNHVCGPNDTTSVCILAQNIPGAQTQLLGTLKSPNVREYTVGGGVQIGNGFIRADYLDRDWRDFYVTLTSLSTGTVVINGNTVTRNLVTNSNALTRTYKALETQFQYRLANNLNFGGNYTYSKLRGNAVQENVGSGPVTDGGWILTFPEYQGFTLNKPVGFLDADQTHKLRAWLSYDVHTSAGNLNFGAIQRYDSGLSYSAVATVDDRFRATFYCLPAAVETAAQCQTAIGKADTSGGITNPGYASNPPGSVTYFVRPRGAFRLDPLRATDISTTYSIGWHGAEVYVEGYVFNVFNTQKVVNTQSGATSTVNTAIRTAITDPKVFRRFNPFTDTPVECPAFTNGVATADAQCVAMKANYQIPAKFSQGGSFGAPTTKDAYQNPRTYSMALGLRF